MKPSIDSLRKQQPKVAGMLLLSCLALVIGTLWLMNYYGGYDAETSGYLVFLLSAPALAMIFFYMWLRAIERHLQANVKGGVKTLGKYFLMSVGLALVLM